MVRTLRFGILGCARICRRGMIEALQHSGSTLLRGIASKRPQVARDWAAEFKIPQAYDSYEAVLADPQIDAVYIPLPNDEHRTWTVKAAQAGKHVLCEKPLAPNLADAEAMVAACQEHNVLLMEAFMWRHHPRTLHLMKLVRQRQLGELRMVKMDFSFPLEVGDWRAEGGRGGGALLDLGCYGINAARLFTGQEPREVLARGNFNGRGADMTMAILLSFPNHVHALIDASFEAPYRNRLELVGATGSAVLPDGVLPAPETELLVSGMKDASRFGYARAQQYTEQVQAFVASVEAGKLIAPAEDGLANMRVVDAALESARGTTAWPESPTGVPAIA